MRERPARLLRTVLGRLDDELDIVSRYPAGTATRPPGVQRRHATLVEPVDHLPHPVRRGLHQPGDHLHRVAARRRQYHHRPPVTHHAHLGLAAPAAHDPLAVPRRRITPTDCGPAPIVACPPSVGDRPTSPQTIEDLTAPLVARPPHCPGPTAPSGQHSPSDSKTSAFLTEVESLAGAHLPRRQDRDCPAGTERSRLSRPHLSEVRRTRARRRTHAAPRVRLSRPADATSTGGSIRSTPSAALRSLVAWSARLPRPASTGA